MEKRKWFCLVVACLCWMVQTSPSTAENIGIGVKANINKLVQTNSCPGCDLKGADLSRMSLAGANLEGANLSGAKIFLTDMAEANLKNANLRGTKFGGTDIARADLRGADLRGADLSGAYVEGAQFDGEFVPTQTYEEEGITEIQSDVYVQDTAKPKVSDIPKEVTIGKRRDFQESPPVLTKSIESTTEAASSEKTSSEPPIDAKGSQGGMQADSWKVIEQKSAAVKQVQPIKEVSFQNDEHVSQDQKTLSDTLSEPVHATSVASDQQLEAVETTDAGKEKMVENSDSKIATAPVSETPTAMKAVSPKKAPTPPAEVKVKGEPGEENKDNSESLWASLKRTLLGSDSASSEQEPSVKKEDQEPKAANVVKEEMTAEDTGKHEQPVVKEEAMGPSTKSSNDNTIVEESLVDTPQKLSSESDREAVKKSMVTQEADSEMSQQVEPEDPRVSKLRDSKKCYHCDLKNLNLAGMDLENGDLEGADLSGANLEGANLEGANLRAARLIGANLINANLEKSDLYKADLTGADLSSANLKDALMDDADITGVSGMQVESVLLTK